MLRLLAVLLCWMTITASSVAMDRDFITWGDHLEGPVLLPEELDGRILLLIDWDAERSNVEWIRKIGEVRKRFGDKLLVVANHSVMSNPQIILDAWSIVEGSEAIPLYTGSLVSTRRMAFDEARSPNRIGLYGRTCYLFDHLGSLVALDSLEAIQRQQLSDTYRRAPGHLAHGRDWAILAREAAALGEASRPFAPILEILRQAFDQLDLARIDEAQELLDRTAAWAAREMAEIERLEKYDATVCAVRLNRMALYLRGDELGEPFAAKQKVLRDDPGFTALLRAESALRSIRQESFSIGLARYPDQVKNNRGQAGRLRRYTAQLNSIIDALPETWAAEAAQRMLAGYGL